MGGGQRREPRRRADVESRKKPVGLTERTGRSERERYRGRGQGGDEDNSLGREVERIATERGCRERPEGLVFIASPVDVVVVGVVAVVVVVDSLDSLVKFHGGVHPLLSLTCIPPAPSRRSQSLC